MKTCEAQEFDKHFKLHNAVFYENMHEAQEFDKHFKLHNA